MEFFALLYVAVLLVVLIAAIIVVFHLWRYSLDQKIARRTTIIFVVVTVVLVLVNIFFFLQIPFDSLTNTNASRF